MKKSAIVSSCGKYRYELRRIWNRSRPWVLFICLNPSTADHEADDNTSRVCINYAKRWNFGGLVIANLFAYRSTNRSALYQVPDPIGPDNDKHLRRLSKRAAVTVCAWTDDGGFMDRDLTILPLLHSPQCLVRLRSGRPGHPLYKSKELTPIPLFLNEDHESFQS